MKLKTLSRKSEQTEGQALSAQQRTENSIDQLIHVVKVFLLGGGNSNGVQLRLIDTLENWSCYIEGLPHQVSPVSRTDQRELVVASRFLACLGRILNDLRCDVRAAYERDPAANSISEVVLTYPGIHAIIGYRMAHLLLKSGVSILPRFISNYVLSKTSIDIHPAARIGSGFFIDHGIGVVIGSTAIVGDNVTLYQGVTLGAKNIPLAKSNEKRHPTLEDGVVVYAHSLVLGGDTIIGKNVIISASSRVTRSIPSGTMLSQGTKLCSKGCEQ